MLDFVEDGAARKFGKQAARIVVRAFAVVERFKRHVRLATKHLAAERRLPGLSWSGKRDYGIVSRFAPQDGREVTSHYAFRAGRRHVRIINGIYNPCKVNLTS